MTDITLEYATDSNSYNIRIFGGRIRKTLTKKATLKEKRVSKSNWKKTDESGGTAPFVRVRDRCQVNEMWVVQGLLTVDSSTSYSRTNAYEAKNDFEKMLEYGGSAILRYGNHPVGHAAFANNETAGSDVVVELIDPFATSEDFYVGQQVEIMGSGTTEITTISAVTLATPSLTMDLANNQAATTNIKGLITVIPIELQFVELFGDQLDSSDYAVNYQVIATFREVLKE